ncbi:MAG: hypothetical protein Q9193_003813, partial [Seirophora villosa]
MNPSSTAIDAQPTQLDHDRHSELVAAAVFLLVATSLAVAVRFWAQRTIGKHWKADNIVMYIAACVYVVGILQVLCLGLVKISILFFYRRIFTTLNRGFKYALYLLSAYTALLMIATLVVNIARCQPTHYSWDQAYLIEGVHRPYAVKGYCLEPRSQILGFLLPNTVGDFAVLILPAPPLWNLQLSRAKKIGLFGVFWLGI